ncbi:MAG: ZIP family metal transporter [bacterium]|nr:ZIP family metal transporter [bacterium]
MAGFFLFLVTEQLLHWHHSHRTENHPHEKRHLGILSLLGDGMHNFLDGVIVAASFLVDPALGTVTVAAVALHEIPQEIAEFGVLIYAGFSRIRALLLLFLSASPVVLGGVAGLLLARFVEPHLATFLLFVVGTFLYVGASDFVPEIRKERRMLHSLSLSLIFAVGILLMWVFTFLE